MISEYVTPKGLDLNSSDIERPPNRARDLLNCHLNDANELVKRFGHTAHSTLANTLNLFEYKKTNTLMALTTTGLYEYKSSTWNKVPEQFDGGIIYTVGCSIAEQDGLLFIADVSGLNPLMKFDGFSFFQSGSPFANVTSHTETGGSVPFDRYIRPVIAVLHHGGFTYSNTETLDSKITTAKEEFILQANIKRNSSRTGTDTFSKFEPKWIKGTFAGTPGLSNVINSTSHNLSVGDVLYVFHKDIILPIKGQAAIVTDITGSVVTFDISNFDDGFAWYNANQSGMVLVPFFSENTTDNFLGIRGVYTSFDEGVSGIYLAGNYPLFKVSTDTYDTDPDSFDHSTLQIPMEDVYDTTQSKLIAPRVRHVTFHQNLMVLSGRISTDSDPANERERNSIYWSDTDKAVGSNVENFPPNNFQEIGNTSDGYPVSAMSTDNGLVVFEEKQFSYISGTLIPAKYNIVNGRSTGVGNVSPTIDARINGNVIFANKSGLFHYNQNASYPSEFGRRVRPLFTDGYGFDLDKITSTVDSINERLLLFLPHSTPANSRVLVYDYHHDEFFVYDINASGGLVTMDNGDFYYSDGTDVFKQSISYNDGGSAINAYWKSGFDSRGNPSVESNFIKLNVYSILSTPWKCNVKSYIDWTDTNRSNINVNFNGTRKFLGVGFTKERANAMSIEIGNDVIDEPMHITGFQYEASDVQQRPKR